MSTAKTIKRELTAEEFKAATPEDQALYTKGDDGNYQFIGENAGELRRAKSRVSTDLSKVTRERDAALSKLAEYEQQQEDASREKEAKATADVKKIDEYWKAKYNKELQSKDQQIEKLNQSIIRQYRDSIISSQASKLALPEHDYVIRLALGQRIHATLDLDGQPQTVIHDMDGRPGHDTLEDLTKEFKKDPRFRPLLKGADVGSGTAKPAQQQPQPQPQQTTAESSSPTRPATPQFQQAPIEEAANNFRKFSEASPDRLAQFLTTSQGGSGL